MDLADVAEKLLNSNSETFFELGGQIANQIKSRQLKIIDLVQTLDSILTNTSHEVRLKGVKFLSLVTVSLPHDVFTEKEVEVMTEFLCLRLLDHKSMVQPVLRCLSFFIDCDKKPMSFHTTVVEFLKTKTNVQSFEPSCRLTVYDITKKLLVEKLKTDSNIDSDTVYSLVHIIEGESNPQNLLSCFGLISFVMKNFVNLEPYIDDFFEWLASYYPIDYSPSENGASITISRSELVEALYDCFYANQLNSPNLQTLLLEKLESNLLSTKIESLNCLIKCYQKFNLKSIKDYASSLWTCVRMDCLKRTSLVDPELLKVSYAALGALARKLSEDDELYLGFIIDMYEELSIAFRKPEMELFEPASCLLANAATPKVRGFNFILTKIVPTAINAILSKELRPISGLTYIFEKLVDHHPSSPLIADLNEPINTLITLVIPRINSSALRLVKALVRCKVSLEAKTLDALIESLLVKDLSDDIEECLALVCIHYTKYDIIFETQSNSHELRTLIKNFDLLNHASCKQFSIYMRIIIILLTEATAIEANDLDLENLDEFLLYLRSRAVSTINNPRIIHSVALVHAIFFNKLGNDKVEPLIMKLFSSDYCQKLIPDKDEGSARSLDVYLPILGWILKSLTIRNHYLSGPMVNLISNLVSSNKINIDFALKGVRIFSFVLDDQSLFNAEKNFQIFVLYKQKFYSQSSKELKIRYEKEKNPLKKCLLISAIAFQVPKLHQSAFKKDFEWLLREMLKAFANIVQLDNKDIFHDDFVVAGMDCLSTMIKKDTSGNLFGLVNTLVDLDLKIALESGTTRGRKSALDNLYVIASSIKESELLFLRQIVIDKLRPCLSDKKRLVRQAAAQARLRWIVIGQPIR